MLDHPNECAPKLEKASSQSDLEVFCTSSSSQSAAFVSPKEISSYPKAKSSKLVKGGRKRGESHRHRFYQEEKTEKNERMKGTKKVKVVRRKLHTRSQDMEVVITILLNGMGMNMMKTPLKVL